MARVLADENTHPDLIAALESGNHDVATVVRVGLAGAADEAVLERANREDRILLTADKDFGLILEFGPLSNRGRVLLLRYDVLNWRRIARDVEEILRLLEGDYRGDPRLLVVLSERGYRVRRSASA